MATSTASTLRWSSTSWVKNIGGSANESMRVIDGRPTMIVLAQKNAKNSRKLIVMGGMPERAKEFQFLEVGVGYCRHHVLPVVLLKQECQRAISKPLISKHSNAKIYPRILVGGNESTKMKFQWMSSITYGVIPWLTSKQVAYAGSSIKADAMYEIGELFELGIQLSYLLLLLALLGVGSFFVIRQVLVRRELDLSAKELQEQVRSGDANATELFELGAVMLRRKFYPAATKYLIQAVEKWDGDDQDLAQVYNALGVSFVREGKLDKGITQFETAVKLQPGYVTAWNNLGDAYEQKKELKSALRAFEEVLLFDPNNKVARPRVDSLRERVQMYKGVPIKSKER